MDAVNQVYKMFFSENLPLRIRLFNIMFFGGLFTGIIGTVTNIVLQLAPITIILSAAVTVFMPTAFFIAYRTKKYDLMIIIGLVGVNFLFFPAIFLASGAIQCGMPCYFILGMIFTILMVKNNKVSYFLIGLELLFYSAVIYVSFKYPNIVLPLPSPDQKYPVIYSNILINALSIGLVVKILTSQYSKDRKSIDKLVNRLEDLTVRDPLTAIFNRRYMMDFLNLNIKRSFDYGLPLTVVLFDIDKFKLLNDDFGHVTGDEVLKGVSAILKKSIRSNDIVARYGGEEFIIVFPDTGVSTAYKRAEQIRERIEKANFSDCIDRKVTISGGIGEYMKGMSPEQLIDSADKNLYLSKEAGRNRVTK